MGVRVGVARGQESCLPPTLDDMVDARHPVRVVADFIEHVQGKGLALRSCIHRLGRNRYDPWMLLAVWLYGCMTRVRSSRRLERACRENIPFIWLSETQQPDHVTLARFFKQNKETIKALFKETVAVAVEANLVGFAMHAVDGTKVGAVSVQRTLDEEGLGKLLQRAEATIEELSQAIEQERDEGETDDRLPKEMAKAAHRRERIVTAIERVRARAKQSESAKGESSTPPQVNPADPEAVLIKGSHGYVTGYNAQAVVDAKAQIIVAADVVAKASDNAELPAMLKQAKEVAGKLAAVTACDAGYHSPESLKAVEEKSTDLYMPDAVSYQKEHGPQEWAFHKDRFVYDPVTDSYTCPEGKRLRFVGEDKGKVIKRIYRCQGCLRCRHFGDCTQDRYGRRLKVGPNDELLQRHREKMRSIAAKGWMKLRRMVVEPVFGIIKEHLGLNRFLRRGVPNVRAEWQLLCAAHNLRKVCAAGWKREPTPGKAAA